MKSHSYDPMKNDRVKSMLAKNNTCYVLITCNDSQETGKMEIEMTYKGDASLASYLLLGAKDVIDEEFEESHHLAPQNKIIPIK